MEGFAHRRLEEVHADYIVSFWPYFNQVPSTVKISYFKTLIRNFHSVGIFNKKELDKPIAWCVQYPYGALGNLFVMEDYRRRGFASLIIEYMCKRIQRDGMVPYAGVTLKDDAGTKLLNKMGFVEFSKWLKIYN